MESNTQKPTQTTQQRYDTKKKQSDIRKEPLGIQKWPKWLSMTATTSQPIQTGSTWKRLAFIPKSTKIPEPNTRNNNPKQKTTTKW